MNFKESIINYESYNQETYHKKIGNIPVILTAVHTMNHFKIDGTTKPIEPFTKAIALYTAAETNSFAFVKIKDTGIDSNSLIEDEFKITLLDIIKKNNIKLLIDIHGADEKRTFDVELGTLYNLSADYSTIKELEDAFKEQGINNISINEPFKGGGITQYIYHNTNIDIIQLEINRRYRDINNPDNIEKICNSLISFINQYTTYQKKDE